MKIVRCLVSRRIAVYRRTTPACIAVLLSVTLLPAHARAAAADVRLANAAAQQDKTAVRALLKAGADVNAPQADGSTALLWAAHWNDLEMADLLLKARANPNATDDHGVAPMAL